MKSKTGQHSSENDLLIPAKDVLCMIVNLPSTVDEEIKSMVQLQVETLSPYPAEKTASSWEVLFQKNGFSRVLIAICAIQKLETFRKDHRSESQEEPGRIDVDLLAAWDLIRTETTIPDTAGTFILLYLGEYLYLLGADANGLCMIRALPNAGNLSLETMQEELQLANINLASTFPETAFDHLQLWLGSEVPDWSESLRQQWSGSLHQLEDLPPLAEALESRSKQPSVLDLTPSAWRTEKQKKLSRKKNLTVLRLSLGVWILFMAVVLTVIQVSTFRLKQQQEEILLKREGVEQVAALATKLRSLTQFTDQKESALNTLLLLAKSIPGNDNVQIETFRFQREEQAFCTGRVEGSIDSFHLFLEALSSLEDLVVNQYELKERSNGLNFQLDFRWKDWPVDSGEIL